MPRWLEVLLVTAGLLVLSPLLLLLALVVLMGSGRPVLYRQVRVGCDGRPFRLLKFRTMTLEADLDARLTVGADTRVTRVGAFLRPRRLDELPQLLNVLCGDMALVGPRPEVPEYVLPELADQVEVLRHRPGLTDPASLAFRDEAALLAAVPDPEAFYRTRLLPAKVKLSADYLRRRTLLSDVGVILRTLGCVVGLPLPSASLLAEDPAASSR